MILLAPHPRYRPAEVAAAVVRAWEQAGAHGAARALAICWRFASPTQRATLGGREAFDRLWLGEMLAPLREGALASLGPPSELGRQALVPLRVVHRGRAVAFTLTLERAHPPDGHADAPCWLVEGLLRVG